MALDLSVEHAPKPNLVWTAALAVAWKELVAMAGGPIELAGGEADDAAAATVRALNNSPSIAPWSTRQRASLPADVRHDPRRWAARLPRRANKQTRGRPVHKTRNRAPFDDIEPPMQVQLRTDASIEGSEGLAAHVTSVVESALSRFSDRITRVDVHVSDENGSKGGQDDKRCSMEARLDGRPPAGVTNHGATIDQAIKGAIDKLERALEHSEGRRDKDQLSRRQFHGT